MAHHPSPTPAAPPAAEEAVWIIPNDHTKLLAYLRGAITQLKAHIPGGPATDTDLIVEQMLQPDVLGVLASMRSMQLRGEINMQQTCRHFQDHIRGAVLAVRRERERHMGLQTMRDAPAATMINGAAPERPSSCPPPSLSSPSSASPSPQPSPQQQPSLSIPAIPPLPSAPPPAFVQYVSKLFQTSNSSASDTHGKSAAKQPSPTIDLTTPKMTDRGERAACGTGAGAGAGGGGGGPTSEASREPEQPHHPMPSAADKPSPPVPQPTPAPAANRSSSAPSTSTSVLWDSTAKMWWATWMDPDGNQHTRSFPTHSSAVSFLQWMEGRRPDDAKDWKDPVEPLPDFNGPVWRQLWEMGAAGRAEEYMRLLTWDGTSWTAPCPGPRPPEGDVAVVERRAVFRSDVLGFEGARNRAINWLRSLAVMMRKQNELLGVSSKKGTDKTDPCTPPEASSHSSLPSTPPVELRDSCGAVPSPPKPPDDSESEAALALIALSTSSWASEPSPSPSPSPPPGSSHHSEDDEHGGGSRSEPSCPLTAAHSHSQPETRFSRRRALGSATRSRRGDASSLMAPPPATAAEDDNDPLGRILSALPTADNLKTTLNLMKGKKKRRRADDAGRGSKKRASKERAPNGKLYVAPLPPPAGSGVNPHTSPHLHPHPWPMLGDGPAAPGDEQLAAKHSPRRKARKLTVYDPTRDTFLLISRGQVESEISCREEGGYQRAREVAQRQATIWQATDPAPIARMERERGGDTLDDKPLDDKPDKLLVPILKPPAPGGG
ncbi:unnamed protein product [Vitrella brassicaformis CCMP3155]|uniref:Uncharacterized protein n=1 Tax=Vitrella brassicaformis (strain CCMP3155) TaxID=1169540 RepID=A0A0G4FY15_VITBC|nr:unnamed protein product [Vitrella brassicaformis CCMP3155]|eukprot:CEM20225.1 unnamed protein product [Vitrella brassicaformis CCMP3155]